MERRMRHVCSWSDNQLLPAGNHYYSVRMQAKKVLLAVNGGDKAALSKLEDRERVIVL